MLFTLMRSPYQCDLNALLRSVTAEDALLLLQDGVTAAIDQSKAYQSVAQCQAKLYVLKEDLIARGISGQISTNFAVIDYNEFVALTAEHRQQVAW